MKTPEEWTEWHMELHPSDRPLCHHFIEAIQRDALSDPLASTTDQQELEIIRDVCNNLEHECRRLSHNVEYYKERWHEARRHLRAANKGAQRNHEAMMLAIQRYHNTMNSEKIWNEREKHKHKTIVWNWLCMSDEDYRLKCGELSSQDLRNIRAVLKAMLGTSLIKHL